MANPVAVIEELCELGWGHARFTIDETGTLRQQATVITVKPLPNEPLDHFLDRVRAGYMAPGDVLELIVVGDRQGGKGRLDIAKITKIPRC